MFVYERPCVRSVFRGNIRSISMSLEAYRKLTEQWGAFGRECVCMLLFGGRGLGTDGGEGGQMRGGVDNAAGLADEWGTAVF